MHLSHMLGTSWKTLSESSSFSCLCIQFISESGMNRDGKQVDGAALLSQLLAWEYTNKQFNIQKGKNVSFWTDQ